MQDSYCDKFGEDLLKTLWLQRLPTYIQAVLSTSNDNIAQLVKVADTIFGMAESHNELSNELCILKDEITSLKRRL